MTKVKKPWRFIAIVLLALILLTCLFPWIGLSREIRYIISDAQMSLGLSVNFIDAFSSSQIGFNPKLSSSGTMGTANKVLNKLKSGGLNLFDIKYVLSNVGSVIDDLLDVNHFVGNDPDDNIQNPMGILGTASAIAKVLMILGIIAIPRAVP